MYKGIYGSVFEEGDKVILLKHAAIDYGSYLDIPEEEVENSLKFVREYRGNIFKVYHQHEDESLVYICDISEESKGCYVESSGLELWEGD